MSLWDKLTASQQEFAKKCRIDRDPAKRERFAAELLGQRYDAEAPNQITPGQARGKNVPATAVDLSGWNRLTTEQQALAGRMGIKTAEGRASFAAEYFASRGERHMQPPVAPPLHATRELPAAAPTPRPLQPVANLSPWWLLTTEQRAHALKMGYQDDERGAEFARNALGMKPEHAPTNTPATAPQRPHEGGMRMVGSGSAWEALSDAERQHADALGVAEVARDHYAGILLARRAA